MEENRAIRPGYMTVGELAKKMGTTVRTLQYYDREGLLSPSAQSTGGRRLYTDRDLISLYQILSLKQLGFSLEDIKERVLLLESPADVAQALTQQAEDLQGKIEALSESLRQIELLRDEALQMQTVDFKRYADILVNLQLKNEHYRLIKHFGEKTMEHIRTRFTKESGLAFMKMFDRLGDEIITLQKNGVPPDSEQGLAAAEAFWKMVLDFAGGDMSLVSDLIEAGSAEKADGGTAQKQALVNQYIEQALDAYFTKLGKDPFEEGNA